MQSALQALHNFIEIYSSLFIIIALSALIFTALTGVPGQACNSDKRWWKNPGIVTDIFYMVTNPIFASFLAQLPLLATILILGIFFPIGNVHAYLLEGRGPFSGLSTPLQIAGLILVQDFLFIGFTGRPTRHYCGVFIASTILRRMLIGQPSTGYIRSV